MRRSNKINVPLNRAIRELKVICHRSILKASMLYNFENPTLKSCSPHHTSCQKLIMEPSPTSNLAYLENSSKPLLMNFQRPNPYDPMTPLEHNPPHRLPYLTSNTILQEPLSHKRNTTTTSPEGCNAITTSPEGLNAITTSLEGLN